MEHEYVGTAGVVSNKTAAIGSAKAGLAWVYDNFKDHKLAQLAIMSTFTYEKVAKFFALGKEKKKKHGTGTGIVEVIQTAQATVGEKYIEFMKSDDKPGMTKW